MKKSLVNKAKEIFSLIVAICVLFSVFTFTGCTSILKSATVTANDVAINEDVLVYFLDEALVDLGVDAEYDDVEAHTLSLVNHYFRTNSLAAAEGVTLSTADKAEVSQRVNSTWSIYGSYYGKIGITRETLTKIYTADAFRNALMMKYYGKGGIQEISESRLYANFRTNYTVFQSITGYLTTTDGSGNTSPISKSEAETLILKFQNMASMVNSGEQTMEEAADYLASTGVNSAVQTVVLRKDDTSYPTGFFEKIQSLKSRTATIISTNEYMFLVLRGEINMESQYFKQMKNELIADVASESIDEVIDGAYIINNTVNKETVQSYLAAIKYEKSL